METPVESLAPAHPGEWIEQSHPETGLKTSDFYRTKNIPERFNHPGSSQCIFGVTCKNTHSIVSSPDWYFLCPPEKWVWSIAYSVFIQVHRNAGTLL